MHTHAFNCVNEGQRSGEFVGHVCLYNRDDGRIRARNPNDSDGTACTLPQWKLWILICKCQRPRVASSFSNKFHATSVGKSKIRRLCGKAWKTAFSPFVVDDVLCYRHCRRRRRRRWRQQQWQSHRAASCVLVCCWFQCYVFFLQIFFVAVRFFVIFGSGKLPAGAFLTIKLF